MHGRPWLIHLHIQKSYLVLLVADVFKDSAVTKHEVLVFVIANLSCGVLYHVVVDVELIPYEVDIED